MNKPPAILIELFGQPGAGKSTIARAIRPGWLVSRAQLGEEWRRERFGTKLSVGVSAVTNGRLLAAMCVALVRLRLFHPDSITRLLRLALKARWMRRRSDAILIEEGHLQDLWSILFSARNLRPDAAKLAPLIKCLYDGVVATVAFLDIEPEEVSRRIGQREAGQSRLDRMDAADLKVTTFAARDLARQIAEAGRLAGLRVERLDASRPVESSVRAVQSLVEVAKGENAAVGTGGKTMRG